MVELIFLKWQNTEGETERGFLSLLLACYCIIIDVTIDIQTDHLLAAALAIEYGNSIHFLSCRSPCEVCGVCIQQ